MSVSKHPIRDPLGTLPNTLFPNKSRSIHRPDPRVSGWPECILQAE